MLKRENELRLCDAVQEMYDEQREKHICPSADIEDSIQRLVLEEFGFDPWDELSLGLYRSTRARFPDDPVLKSVYYILNMIEAEIHACELVIFPPIQN